MRIGIPVNEGTKTGGVCASFGRAPYFLVHDPQEGTDRFLENPATKSPDGAGIQAAQCLTEEGVTVLLAPRLGGNALRVLRMARVEVFKTRGDSIADNLEAYTKGHLEPLVEAGAGYHGHGRA